MMRSMLSVISLVVLSSTLTFAGESFPQGPRIERTPGSVCQTGRTYRYPQHVLYCDRHVDSSLKNDIIKVYDQQFGYSISSMPRRNFKIDHYIPLCAGGSNDETNLWPQHESVYRVTDPLEPLVCQKMSDGRLSQADAIAYIKEAKNDLSKVQAIIQQVDSL